jgi:hypothetical protein
MTLVARSSDWMIRPFERSGLAPWWLGLAIVFSWPTSSPARLSCLSES